MNKRVFERLIDKNFILITEESDINAGCFSSSYIVLDNNRNYVATLGKSKYIDELVAFETANIKTEEELITWFNDKNKTFDNLTEQDKRNLISMGGFQLHFHNTLDYYYFVKPKNSCNDLDIEKKQFNTLDEVILELDCYLSAYATSLNI